MDDGPDDQLDGGDTRSVKRAWRAAAAEARRQQPMDSAAYCRLLAPFLADRVASERRVLVYLAMPGEVDLGALVDEHPSPTARFAVTRTPLSGYRLSVHPVGVPLERHRYGYLQPVAGSPEIADEIIGAVLVPGAAFDRSGGRLGHGVGYYDRLLARLPDDALRIGITGDYLVDRLPIEAHDVAMTHLATSAWVLPVPIPATVEAVASER